VIRSPLLILTKENVDVALEILTRQSQRRFDKNHIFEKNRRRYKSLRFFCYYLHRIPADHSIFFCTFQFLKSLNI